MNLFPRSCYAINQASAILSASFLFLSRPSNLIAWKISVRLIPLTFLFCYCSHIHIVQTCVHCSGNRFCRTSIIYFELLHIIFLIQSICNESICPRTIGSSTWRDGYAWVRGSQYHRGWLQEIKEHTSSGPKQTAGCFLSCITD